MQVSFFLRFYFPYRLRDWHIFAPGRNQTPLNIAYLCSMQEIEVKILEVDPNLIEDKLLQMGARKSFEGEMLAMFFDTPGAAIKQKGDVLRLRREGEITVLAYKQRVEQGAAKVMEEIETRVDNLENMRTILCLLGLKEVYVTRKFRSQYDWEDIHVVLDDYQDELADIPVFLEIEAPSLERIQWMVDRLGFQMSDTCNWSTYGVVRHYRQR